MSLLNDMFIPSFLCNLLELHQKNRTNEFYVNKHRSYLARSVYDLNLNMNLKKFKVVSIHINFSS